MTDTPDVIDARAATLAQRLTGDVLIDPGERPCPHGSGCLKCEWEAKIVADHRRTRILTALHPLLTPGFDVGLIEELAETQKDPATKDTLQRLASFVDVLQGNQQPPPDTEAWTPTPDNINELPLPLRWYLHNLAHRTDPAGDLQKIAVLEQSVTALTAKVRELEELARQGHYCEHVGTDGACEKLVPSDDAPADDETCESCGDTHEGVVFRPDADVPLCDECARALREEKSKADGEES